jgi:hypothetical protein
VIKRDSIVDILESGRISMRVEASFYMWTCRSFPVMQLRIDAQIVTCRGRVVSRKVCNRFPDVVKLGKRNAVRTQECHDLLERSGRLHTNSGRLQGFGKTHQSTSSFMHKQKVLPGCSFSLCRSGSRFWPLYSFSSNMSRR